MNAPVTVARPTPETEPTLRLAAVAPAGPAPLVPSRRSGIGPFGRLVKRAFDLVAAAALLLACGPLLLCLMLAIRLRYGGPVLFRQLRVTGPDRLATIVKLRTLPTHTDSDTRWVVPLPEPGLATWLRHSHLDELPQLVNVLRGDLSMVGPRPERPYFAARFAGRIPGYADRHRVKAGITGWAQVHGLHGDTSIADRVRLDNQYIEHWSLRLDLVILIRTLTSAVTFGLTSRPTSAARRRGGSPCESCM